jgi:hypothetical protein
VSGLFDILPVQECTLGLETLVRRRCNALSLHGFHAGGSAAAAATAKNATLKPRQSGVHVIMPL